MWISLSGLKPMRKHFQKEIRFLKWSGEKPAFYASPEEAPVLPEVEKKVKQKNKKNKKKKAAIEIEPRLKIIPQKEK